MKILYRFFMILAGAGFLISLGIHAAAVLGWENLFEGESMLLHAGIFVVWIPAVLAVRKLVLDFKQRDFWKAALRGCPGWMRRASMVLLGYAMLNFVLFTVFATRAAGSDAGDGSGLVSSGVLRLFSGHWMAFYSMSFAILYSAAHVHESDSTRRCPNGHPISPADCYCPECGTRTV